MAHPGQNRGSENGRFLARGPDGEKTCRSCRLLRPIEQFVIDRSRFDGRGYVCDPCRDRSRRSPGPSLRLRRIQNGRGLAWCGGCRDWKIHSTVRSGTCRRCLNLRDRRRYAESADFRDRRRLRSLARKRGIDPVPVAARQDIIEQFDGCCAYCPAPATTFDHVVAFKNGGLTEPYNIVPACARCNSSKRTQNVWLWIEKTRREPHPQFFERLALYHSSIFLAQGPDPFDGITHDAIPSPSDSVTKPAE